MNIKTLITYLLTLCFFGCKKTSAQNLEESTILLEKNKHLIKEDDFEFSIVLLEKDNDNKPSKLNIEIIKNGKITQNVIFIPNAWTAIDGVFKTNSINYFNKNLKLEEGIENYHDFIVDDFNFDNLEDFAILYDYGGSSGPIYSYYFQNLKGEFGLNHEFPLNQGPFPKIINAKSNTLTVSLPIGCCNIETTVFELIKNNKWEVISSKQEKMD